MRGAAIGVLGLDSAGFCPLATTDAPVGLFLVSGSIAWLGEHVHVCGSDGLMRISLRDGTWERPGSRATRWPATMADCW